MDVSEIVEEYLHKDVLNPQDIVKCFLKMYQKSGMMGYDKRAYYWEMRPGDVIYVNEAFYPLVSYPRIDDKKFTCIHMMDHKGRKRFHCFHGCRNWYLYYKKDSGEVQAHHAEFDGATIIKRDHIEKVLMFLKMHKDSAIVEDHYKSASKVTREKIKVIGSITGMESGVCKKGG